MKTFTITLLAEIMTEWIGTQEPDQRIKFSDSILEGSSRETPLVLRIKGECGFSCVCGSFFDIMGFVEDYPTCQLDRMMNWYELTCATGKSERAISPE